MLRVKGEDTCSPFVGLFMTVCASAGSIAAASARQTQDEFRISFIKEILRRNKFAA
jgi:hypothetical protein